MGRNALLIAAVVLVCCVEWSYAFGAGNIPSFSFIEGKAFRHGDIEDVLAELVKSSAGMFGMGKKFGGLDIKRIYFGNWLRDYSQAMDIAGLSKMPKQAILNLIMVLGFMAHGYATGAFEVTDERLGVYLCTEHIDNPKGYADDQPGKDARKWDPRLRPPVDPRELEIDPRTGMKNYIANESGTWDTSSRLVRERIIQCIELGRRAKHSGDKADLYESYRLLGTFLHTLEDFSAHSNWCELSLRRMGYRDVFCHVGDACVVQTPSGPAPPLVTGTFGGPDFLHSLLGEATDHISEASVSDLAKAIDSAKARSAQGGAADSLRDMLFNLPGGGGQQLSRDMNDVENIRAQAQNGAYDQLSPQELHATLWKLLSFRDNVCLTIESTIEKIPGLSTVVEKLTDAINRFVFTTLEPLLKPLMGQATNVLGQGSAAVISNEAQYEVFDNPHASDPTHSFLSKDHFSLILNEPAGLVASVIVRHTVKLIVKAWDHDDMDPRQVASDILEAFHHPYFYNDHSTIQKEMGQTLKQWIESQRGDDKQYILNALTKQSVRNHKNHRKGHKQDQIGHGAGGHYNSVLSPEKVSSFAQQHIPGASGVVHSYNQAQHTWNSASQAMGFREMRDEAPPGTYMPQPGAPPFDHGTRPLIPSDPSSFESPSSYPQPHQYGHQPSEPGQYGGSYGQPGFGAYQQGPLPSHQQQGPGYPGGFQSGPPLEQYYGQGPPGPSPGGFQAPPYGQGPPPGPNYGGPPPQQGYNQGYGGPNQGGYY